MGKLLSLAMVLTMATGTAYAQSDGRPAVRVYTPAPNYSYEELAQKIDELRALVDQMIVLPEIEEADSDFPWSTLTTHEDMEEEAPVFQF